MKSTQKLLEVDRCDALDSMSLEAASNYMEQHLGKTSIECRNWPVEFPYQPLTAFAIAYTSQYIYINYFVRGNYLRAVNDKNNSPVHEDSCVEFFVKLPDSPEYWNFEFNCIGTPHCAHRIERPAAIKLTDEQLASIRRYSSCGSRPFEEMEGMFSWNLIVAIPLSLLGIDVSAAPVHLKGNFYKCGDKMTLPHFLSWAPIDLKSPNFHCPLFFGDIILK